MKIHYYYKNDSSNYSYNLELRAYLEEKVTSRQGEDQLSFTEIEKIRIFISKGSHSNRIEHSFGKNSCMGHFAHTRKGLTKDMEKWSLYPVNRRNFERLRKVALSLYQKQSPVDFSDFKGKQNYTKRVILGG